MNDCKVIPLKNGLLRQGRRGVAQYEPGRMLYFIWNERTGLYFKTCYVDQQYAISKASEMKGPTSMPDVAEWWVTSPKHCEHSFKTED